jgi:hypothetical protein
MLLSLHVSHHSYAERWKLLTILGYSCSIPEPASENNLYCPFMRAVVLWVTILAGACHSARPGDVQGGRYLAHGSCTLQHTALGQGRLLIFRIAVSRVNETASFSVDSLYIGNRPFLFVSTPSPNGYAIEASHLQNNIRPAANPDGTVAPTPEIIQEDRIDTNQLQPSWIIVTDATGTFRIPLIFKEQPAPAE